MVQTPLSPYKTVWVKPRQPLNAVGDALELVDGNDLCFWWPVSDFLSAVLLGFRLSLRSKGASCLVLPDLLDIDRFCKTLSSTLSLYPTFSGRLKKPGHLNGNWKVKSPLYDFMLMT